MLVDLKIYKYNDSFVFKIDDSLKEVCNAPRDQCGVYQVFEITNNTKKLIYIGSSGHIKNDGKFHIRKTGGGGIRGRIVNGHQFNKEKRRLSWPKQMKLENISELEIHWYVTYVNDEVKDSPCYVEYCLLQGYFNLHYKLPKWNLKF